MHHLAFNCFEALIFLVLMLSLSDQLNVICGMIRLRIGKGLQLLAAKGASQHKLN
jgi:hypothetical protein